MTMTSKKDKAHKYNMILSAAVEELYETVSIQVYKLDKLIAETASEDDDVEIAQAFAIMFACTLYHRFKNFATLSDQEITWELAELTVELDEAVKFRDAAASMKERFGPNWQGDLHRKGTAIHKFYQELRKKKSEEREENPSKMH